jgi:hypothetical protein
MSDWLLNNALRLTEHRNGWIGTVLSKLLDWSRAGTAGITMRVERSQAGCSVSRH